MLQGKIRKFHLLASFLCVVVVVQTEYYINMLASVNMKSFSWTVLMIVEFLFVTNLQTCQCNETLPYFCVWRVSVPLSEVGLAFIGVNVPFEVSYLDSCAQGLQWDATGGCIVHNQSSLDTSIQCPYPGLHTITPVIQQPCGHCIPNGKPIAVRSDPLCYRWYAKSIHQESKWNEGDTKYGQWTSEILRVWVVDWLKAGQDERNENATTPSQFSTDLTRMFHSKGQRPMIKQLHPTNQQELQTDNATFHRDLGYWEIDVTVPVYSELELKITGRPEVAAHMCFIGDTTVMLTNHWFPKMFEDEITPLLYTPGHPRRLVQDPCASYVAVLLSQGFLLLTQDGFLTSKKFSLPSNLLQSVSPEVESITFTPTHLLLLIDSKVFALHRTLANFTQITGLSGQSAIKGRDWCIPASLHRSQHAVAFSTSSVFLISTRSPSDHRLYSQEIPLPLALLQVHGFTAGLTMEIEDVGFDSFFNKLGLAVRVTQHSHSALLFLLYDITSASWSHLPIWLDARDTCGGVSLLSIKSAHDAGLLFWDQKSVHFSYHSGQYGSFTIRGSETTMLNVSSSEVISQVSVSQSGDILVLLSSNRLYYSRIGLTTLISLPASELPMTLSTLMLDGLSSLFIITTENTSTTVGTIRWRYPLHLEVAGILHNSQNLCPYKHFEHGDVASVYYLDSGDMIQLWTSLTFPDGADVNLQVISSTSDLLHFSEEDDRDYHPGWLAVNKTLIIRPNVNLHELGSYEEDSAKLIGDAVVEVRPDQHDVTCKKPASMVAHFTVGCPPGRHIRVRKPDSCVHFSNYTIPRNAFLDSSGSDPENSKIVEYDWSTYACPLLSRYQQSFRPIIDLYDHDDFVAELSSNYVVVEDWGRTDFSYNMTMLQAGCHSVTPTRDPVTTGNGDVTALQSFQSCFALNASTDSATLGRQHYEVLNSTGMNSIVWTSVRNNSVYQFTATVVDPGYSFCRLQAKFAVLVYGHPVDVEKKPLNQISLATFALLTFVLGFISYMYFRKDHIRKLQQQLFDYDTDDQSK